jgi:TP901 family phage tail tape measure protein
VGFGVANRYTGVVFDLIARDNASRQFERVGRSAEGVERSFGRLSRVAVGLGAAFGAAGLGVGLAESAKKAVEFESSMKKVQTQAGGTARDVAVLSKGVLALGKTAQQGPQQLSEAMFHLKSVGLDNASALKDLKVASDLAAVGGSDLEETTNALAGAWRSGIRGASSFAGAAATVNAVIGAGNMKMGDFVEAIGTGILPAAKSFGLSLSQVGSALALMTDEGIPAVDAATRLRMSFSLLGAPSAAADKQLKKIGLSGLDLAIAMRGPQGLIGAVGLLKDRLDKSGLSAAQTSQLLSRAFGGGKSDSAILTMLNNYDVLRQKQDQVNKSMGKFPAAVAAQRKTAEAQLKILESNLDVLAIQIGTKTLPALSGFVQYLSRTALPVVAGFSTALLHMVPVDAIKSGFSTVTGFVSDFVTGLSPKKKPVIELPTPTIKSPVMPVPSMLRRPDLYVPSPTVRVGTTKIPKTLAAPKAVKSQAQKLGEQLRGLISGGIGDAIGRIDWGQLGKRIGEGLGQALQWLTTHAADVTKKLEKAFGGVDWVNVGKTVGGQAVGFTIGFVTSLGGELFSPGFWVHHWWDVVVAALSLGGIGKIAGPLAKVFGKIPVLRVAEPLLKGIGKLTKPFGDGISKVISFFGSSLWKGIARVFPEGTAKLGQEAGLFTTRVGVWGIDLARAGRRAIRGLGNGIKGAFGWVIAKLGEGIGQMLRPFVRAGSWLVRAGGDLLSGLKNGIVDGAKGIGSWINAHIVQPVVFWVKNLFGIHSPSTVFASIGGDLVRGLLGGVAGAMAGIGKWLYGHIVAPIVGAFAGAGGWLYGRGSAVVSGLRSGLADGAAGLGGWVWDHTVAPVRGAFSGAGKWLYDAGASMMYGLLRGIRDGVGAVTGFLGTVKDAVTGSLSTITGDVGGLVKKLPHFAAGGLAPIGQTAWVGERGPELMQVTPRGTRIFSNRDSVRLAGVMGTPVPGYASGTVSLPAARGDVSAAQREVTRLEREIAGLRHDEARAHSRRQRKRDELAIQAAEEDLKAARTRLAAAKKELSAAQAQAKRVQGIANTLANGFLKTLETGSASAIASTIKGLNTKLQAAGYGGLVAGNLRTSSRLQQLAGQRSSIQGRIAQARQYAADQSAGLGDYLSVTGTSATNISDLIGQMRTRQGGAKSFASEVSRLSKMGLSKTLLAQLAEAGPGSQLAATLAGASRADIGQLNKVARSQDRLTTSFGRTMANAMFDSGKQAGRGFLSGLLAQEKAIQSEMNKLATGMVATIKKALGIKSPSTVARDQVGKQFALGAGLGVRIYTPHAVREVQRMADTMAAVRARSATGRAAGGGPVLVRPEVRVLVHFDDPALRDLIRVEVDNGHVELTQALRAGG